MKVLIGCEESGVVRRAFRDRGHDAWSCDLQPSRDGSEHHYQEDILRVLVHGGGEWDLIILHPDCTAMAVSGNRWYGQNMPKHLDRIASVAWTQALWETATERCPLVCLENPVSVIFGHIEYDNLQYIQPWQFGHGETKKTGLALKGLPLLEPTNIVEGRENRIWKMAPSPTRKRDRSETYQGIAEAMADQWGSL